MGIKRHIMRFFGRNRHVMPENPVSPSVSVPNVAGLPKGIETIVVAEDEQPIRLNMVLVLRRLGYKVVEAADGEEALHMLHEMQDRGQKVDLLLTDVVMPRMGGKELAYRVKSQFPTTKVIFSSAYPEKLADHSDVFDQRIPFLQKPVSSRTLAHKVREVLDGGKQDVQYAVSHEEAHGSVAE